jgi:DNA repair helicase Rad3
MATPSSLSPHTYTMNRVKISFPCKAYPSQLSMMNNIVRSLQRSQNALLESPTGSGKSLALLCAALAWQKDEKAKAREYNMAVEQGLIEPEYVDQGGGGEEEEDPRVQEMVKRAVMEAAESGGGGGFINLHEGDFVEDGGGDFVGGRSPPRKRPKPMDQPPPVEQQSRKVKFRTVPKIYFGTRTHKQITQIVRELNKTDYKGVRMTILASRDHTCIHPTVSRSKNRKEGCNEQQDKNKGGGCQYQSAVKSKMATHHAINAYRGSKDAWDLEDLVKVGKKVRACPYYATRELRPKADIIFCPYNYLIEPLIRKSLDISLKGQVVILDEAHNIEDTARSAASWEVTQEAIREAMQDIEAIGAAGVEPEAHSELSKVLSHLAQWIDGHRDQLTDYTTFDSSSKIWTGQEIAAVFKVYGIDERSIETIKANSDKVIAEWKASMESKDETFDPDEKKLPSLHSNSAALLENFVMVLQYLFLDGLKHLGDYRVALTKTQIKQKKQNNFSKPKQSAAAWGGASQWFSKTTATQSPGGSGAQQAYTYTANFWCLNPAVSFDSMKQDTRSIVLTSGTLSPMVSFSSELDVSFPLTLEANHVIDKRQVWIRTVGQGPTGQCLNATYKNTESFAFQDELGRLIAQVCETVAHGILLFLPSYAMLNKLSERWQQGEIWQRIGKRKVIVSEPRFSDEFESKIRHYYDVIKATDEFPNDQGVDGALFIAVCRGKVSEGLDFADNNARAVICVGIPFPNIKDVQVDLKKKYNDIKKREENKNLLSGREWYEIQAFRALNQALGRCIRHRRDWGAILMVDDRYQKSPSYINSLSKWVRSGVSHYNNCRVLFDDLQRFNVEMKQLDAEYKEKEKQEITVSEAVETQRSAEEAMEKVKRAGTDAKMAVRQQKAAAGRKRGKSDETKQKGTAAALMMPLPSTSAAATESVPDMFIKSVFAKEGETDAAAAAKVNLSALRSMFSVDAAEPTKKSETTGTVVTTSDVDVIDLTSMDDDDEEKGKENLPSKENKFESGGGGGEIMSLISHDSESMTEKSTTTVTSVPESDEELDSQLFFQGDTAKKEESKLQNLSAVLTKKTGDSGYTPKVRASRPSKVVLTKKRPQQQHPVRYVDDSDDDFV